MSVRWIGSREITEMPTSPEMSFGEEDEIIYSYEGPYDKCVTDAPRRGDVVKNLWVLTSRVTKMEGGKGRIVVNCSTVSVPKPEPEAEILEVYELDWATHEKALIEHPRYQEGGAEVLTNDDRANLIAWRNQPAPEEKAMFRYPDNFDFVSGEASSKELSGNAQAYAGKILKGTEAYKVSTPVARISSLLVSHPNTSPCDRYRTSVPFEGCPAGYTWLKVADRALRTGRKGQWTRSVEYQGFVDLDTDLYSQE